MAELTAEQRKHLKPSDFAIPEKARTPEERAEPGNYPIEDWDHAKDALARSSGKRVEGKVRRAVRHKYPHKFGRIRPR